MAKRVEPIKTIKRKSGVGHHIRDWRHHRQLSLEAISAQTRISLASLSRVETGSQPYSQPILEALSVVLKCAPGDLLLPVPPATTGAKLTRPTKGLSKKARDALADLAKSDDATARRLAKILAADLAV